MCSHTHWDREWYGSFQEFRMRLVRMIDRLMDILERDPSYRCFNFDGQTIVLEDYLEVRPHQRARIEKLISDGRIVIGPWYILPDEWLVSGEATVRNLLRGRAICREFGVESPNVGYLPDMFGHISQMPQILKRFGITRAIIWRGLSGADVMNELWWDAPDGTRILAYHLPEYSGYINAAFFYHSLPHEARTLPPETPSWGLINQNTQFASDALRVIADRMLPRSRSGCIPFMNGVDHMEAQPTTPEIIRLANRKLADVEVRHSSFEEFIAAVEAGSPADLQTVRGELRSSPVVEESGAVVLPNILSSRIYQKMANARCETLLERWAEPMACAAAWTGAQYPDDLIRLGWMYLLKNHPHDSIGGCSTDEVHRQMDARFEWAAEVASCVIGDSLWKIGEAIDTSSLDEKDAAFLVFNPLGWEVTDLVQVDLDLSLEEGWFQRNGIEVNPANIYQSIRNLSITDWDGNPVTFAITDVRRLTVHRPWMEAFGPTYQTVRFSIALWAEKLPAMGYAGYRVGKVAKWNRMPNRHGTGNPARLENKHLAVDFLTNGSLRIRGPVLGRRVLNGLHYFEDGGEVGDGYTYSMPRHDEVVSSLGGKVQISRLLDEDAVQAVALDYTLDVPEAVTPDRQHRSPIRTPLQIRSVFKLGAESRRIDVETTVTNTARDHRLRVCFPLPKNGSTHVAEMQYDVVERNNEIVQPTERAWIEDMPIEQAQHSFVSYGPVALANFGLPEYELADGPEPVLKLTLMRAANFLGAGSHPNTIIGGAGPVIETPEQQMLGRTLVFRYSIIPHAGDWEAAGVQREAYQHNALWRGVTVYRHSGVLPPSRQSFVSVKGKGIVVSALKQVDDRPGHYVVRFWNSGTKDSRAVVRWFKAPEAVWASDLAENDGPAVPVGRDAKSELVVRPKEIVTIGFRMSSPRA